MEDHNASPHHSGRRPLATAFACLCVAANALVAGGIFCFPLLAPALAFNLQLSQSQLSTIVLAGMAGQYPFAAAVGMFIDRVGPWACSLVASGAFSIGFGLFSYAVSGPPGTLSIRSYHWLVVYFFLAGLATVTSYFSSQFSAVHLFPNKSGVAIGVTTAIFGLSPLFLSILASTFFTDAASGLLDCSAFLRFLAMLTGIVHLISGMGMRAVPRQVSSPEVEGGEPDRSAREPSEIAPLIPKANPDVTLSMSGLLKETDFWCLACVVFVCIGTSEMVISNIGTILLALPTGIRAQTTPSVQVRLLSASNTISRIGAGLVMDHFSPRSASLKIRQTTRIKLVYACALCLTLTYAWMACFIKSQQSIWVLSVGTGAAYGATWTIVPGLVAVMWGTRDAGRNFGLVSYAPFFGTPFFTYLYAFVSDHARREDPTCHGVRCWRTTFRTCTVAAGVATLAASILWRQRLAWRSSS